MQLEIEEAALKKERDKAARSAWRRFKKNWPNCAAEPMR